MLLAQLTPQGQTPTAPLPLDLPDVEYSAILPTLILIGGAVVSLLVVSLLRRRIASSVHAGIAVLSALASGGAAGWLWNDLADGPRTAIAGAIAVDRFSVFFMVVVAVSVLLAALAADGYLQRERLDGPEFYVLMLLSAAGANVMAAANDLIVLFLGLEILSIALYVLAGFHNRRSASSEAAIKYFVLGSFSSAIFLYGIALTYGATGTTNMAGVATYLATNVSTGGGVLLAGTALLLVGLAFKVAAVPFHTWTPDVYQGSPTPATAFMAAAAKAAGFAGLLRLFLSTFETMRVDWRPVVWVLSILTLVVGSVLAVVQDDVKRLLAYSSVSHAGYVLVGVQAANGQGRAGSLFYLLAYAVMAIGSFAVVSVVGGRGDARHSIVDYRGLASRRPGLALALTVFLLAQAGVPFTTGFVAKFYVITAAVQAESYALAIIAMLAAVVGAFVYLRIVLAMYGPAEDGAEPRRLVVGVSAGIALASALVFTLVVGVLPSPVIEFARRSTFLF